MHPFRFSIITVSYNAENEIQRTINSIKAQKLTDYEVLFIDGRSTDKTTVMIAKSGIKNKVVVSEKDAGPYDAMK